MEHGTSVENFDLKPKLSLQKEIDQKEEMEKMEILMNISKEIKGKRLTKIDNSIENEK